MATNKIDRINAEIEKTREKISEQQAHLKELLAQKTELENLQIVQLVRSMRLTPAALTDPAFRRRYSRHENCTRSTHQRGGHRP